MISKHGSSTQEVALWIYEPLRMHQGAEASRNVWNYTEQHLAALKRVAKIKLLAAFIKKPNTVKP